MKTIIFTKKHIVMTVALILALLIFSVGIWITGIGGKQKEAKEFKSNLTSLESELVKLKQESFGLANKKNLLDSSVVNELPRFSNGIQIQGYLTNLEEKVTNNKIELKQITAEDTLLFSSPSDPTKKVYSSKIVLDYSATNKNELLAFMEALENDQRFIKVTDYSYSFNGDDGGQSKFESTLLFNLYYLNIAEEKK
ncbi:hypothetical protein [Enterococcus sp. UD-01]|jgi:hypothetical protein|uniref:hypothetical protein n=1 Tax=Enterococcus sp. UD-01 TaxID=3373911 RepID=UPI003837C958